MFTVSHGGTPPPSCVHFMLTQMNLKPVLTTVHLHRYQQMLHRNLVYLATIADSNQNMQPLLPAVSIGPES